MTTNGRPDRVRYYLDLAKAASMRSTCDRLSVGAAVVLHSDVIGLGYNGAPPGFPHCDEHVRSVHSEGRCANSIHAEVNAIIHALKRGSIGGAELYCTDDPCLECSKVIVAVGITRVVSARPYDDPRVRLLGYEHQSALLSYGGVRFERCGE